MKQKKPENNQRYSYKNKYFDENIQLFLTTPVPLFDKELIIYLYLNKWKTLVNHYFEDKKTHVIFIMCGGDTSSYSISFYKIEDITEKDFMSKYITDNVFYKDYTDIKTIEIPLDGIHVTNKADLMYYTSGYMIDNYDIEEVQITINLYNREKKVGYSVVYDYNISPNSNNFENRYDIFSHIAVSSIFTFLQ